MAQTQYLRFAYGAPKKAGERMSRTVPLDEEFRSWVKAFSEARGYPMPGDDWFARINSRLPAGLRETIDVGIQNETITILDGYRFRLPEMERDRKYAWLAKRDPAGPPWVNWEYFIQAAEYVRLWSAISHKGHTVRFEHDKMDVSVSLDGDVLLYVECKETGVGLDRLVRGLRRWGAKGVPRSRPAEDTDAWEKARSLLKHRPRYFSALSIGKRYDFRLLRLDHEHFALAADLVPPL